MSLNNISLPSQLIADLYQNALVGGTATAMPISTPTPKQVTFLGKNEKGILIIVSKPEVPYLPDHELSFLTKILTACQLGLADVAIVNWHKAAEQEAAAVIEQVAAKNVILFAISPDQFGLPSDLPLFSVYSANNIQYVLAPALEEIEKTKEAKTQLWTSLKQLFGI